MNIGIAVKYLRQEGTDLERARSARIIDGVAPDKTIMGSFVALQKEDGGFPLGMKQGNPSALASTLNAIGWLSDLGLFNSIHAQRALQYLLAAQKDDGGWDEDPALVRYELPHWITPGDLRTMLYLSAYSSYWLALADQIEHPQFRRALYFLISQQEDSGKFFGFLHTTWIAVSAFALAGRPYSKIVRKGIKYLMDENLDEWSDAQIAWALECLGNAGVPRVHPFVSDCIAELTRRQKSDGTWHSENGDAYTVEATLSAVKAFKTFGVMP